MEEGSIFNKGNLSNSTQNIIDLSLRDAYGEETSFDLWKQITECYCSSPQCNPVYIHGYML